MQHLPGRRRLIPPPPVFLPNFLIQAIVKVEVLHMLNSFRAAENSSCVRLARASPRAPISKKMRTFNGIVPFRPHQYIEVGPCAP